jgi:hypothetical protein
VGLHNGAANGQTQAYAWGGGLFAAAFKFFENGFFAP